MSRPLWNSFPDVHGDWRMPNSELTAPRIGHRDGSAASALPAFPTSRSSALRLSPCSATASARHSVDAEGATTDRAIAAAGLELGAERLPDPRVKIAPARHLGAQLDDAVVEGIDLRLLLGDLGLERAGLSRELPELEPVAQETEEGGQRDGQSDERGDGDRPGEVEPENPSPVAPDDEDAELLPVGPA